MEIKDCIGVFDSGLGGLTAVKELRKCLPDENIIYFGDTGRVPYGTRSPATIIKYVRQDIRFMSTFSVKAMLVACGTASSIALPALEGQLPVPTLGVIHCAVETAATHTHNRRVGIIGTPGTISSGAYERELKAIDSEIQTISVACPLFVPLVENGRFAKNDPVPRLVAEDYLRPICDFGVDTLIMGCTHYPLLEDVIRGIMGPRVRLISPGMEGSRSLKEFLYNNRLQNTTSQKGNISYYVSDEVENFTDIASIFLGQRIAPGSVHKIDIETY